MDADRFDTLARRLVTPTTRRGTLGALAAGGVLSALGLGRAVPETRAAQGGVCVLAFVATVRLGPSVDQMLTPAGRAPGEIRGELDFSLSETGNLENGSLILSDGSRFPVVGQATGHALQMRIELGPRVALVAVGVGEREVAVCQGAIDGVVTGPEVGDLGDWHAAGVQQRVIPARSTTPTPAPGTTARPGACASGLTRCGSACVDLGSDLNHCGACDAVCESGLAPVACRSGVCERADCPPGQTYCGAVDGCRDLSSDLSHCGRCGLHCAGGICSAGVCGPAGSMCPEGQADCGEGCTDLSSNDFNCGACGNDCDDGQVCQGGACTSGSVCTGGLTDCGGECVDLSSDRKHCAACGNACAADEGCRGGVCVGAQPICADGLSSCNSVCVDFASDPANCGDCFIACAVGQLCQGGICTGGAPQCTGGLTDCGGVCVNLQSDALNCGLCGLECAYGELCSAGACQSSCAAGLSFCNGVCVDTANDPNHCGFCNNACGGFSQCVSGACISTGEELPGSVLNCIAQGLTDCGGVCVDLMTNDLNCGACGNNCTNMAGYCDKGDGMCSVCSWRIGDPNPEPRCTS